MLARRISLLFLLCVIVLSAVQPVMADKVYTYTLTDDFENGVDGGIVQLVDLNSANDQLQLGITDIPYPFVNIAATGRGTIVRIDAASGGNIIGEYRTAPQGLIASPSRLSVDSKWNVWAGKSTGTMNVGDSVVKIGAVVGGTRVSLDGQGNSIADPSGPYLQGPFDYNTCQDRNQDNLIRTSRGLSDVLPWPNINDSGVKPDGIVQDAVDECILIFKRLPGAPEPQHVSVDGNDDVWVGGYPGLSGYYGNPTMFYQLSGDDGTVLDSFDASVGTGFGCGGFGGLVDKSGILWSASWFQNKLLRYNPATRQGGCIAVNGSWGVAVDAAGFLWNSLVNSQAVAKIDPSGAPSQVFPLGGTSTYADRGVAITPADNNVWVAKAGSQQANEVRRLDNDGGNLRIISLVDPMLSTKIGRGPTGFAVDSNGKVWVANQGTDNIMRIDPTLNQVDKTIDLSAGAPNSYSDMTKVIPITGTASQGTWTVINDGGEAGTIWDVITWNTEPEGSEPQGTLITVEAQAADAEGDLDDDNNYVLVSNGGQLLLSGRYIKIRSTLESNDSAASPVLSDLEIFAAENEVIREVCFVNDDDIVDREDISLIMEARNTPALPDNDLRDADGDGIITILDARKCVLKCTYPGCASEAGE